MHIYFNWLSVMPVYDLTLRDYLKYLTNGDYAEYDDFFSMRIFPFCERFEMLKRISDGLLFMNEVMVKPHGDLKPRSDSNILILIVMNTKVFLFNQTK